MTDLAAFSGAFADLPRELLPELSLSRSAVRTDGALVVFNWVDPPATLPLHDHPFDQLALILAGRASCGWTRRNIPSGREGSSTSPRARGTAWRPSVSEPVLNVDVFSPAREDYLHLAEEQPRG